MANDTSIRILTVESSSASQASLSQSLAPIPDLQVVAQASSDSDTLLALKHNNVDLVVIDLGFTDDGGIGLTRKIRELHPNIRMVIRTASDKPEDIFAAMDAGADGYVLQGNEIKVLETAIRSVRLGAVWLDPGIAQQVLQVMETKASTPSRVLPTGLMTLPLMPDEKSLLFEVAGASCVDGVCMVDPSFLKKLRRFSQGD